MFLKDPNSGQPSPTTTVFVIGSLVCVLKLILSGFQLGSFQSSQFTGVDFAAAVGALGAVYVMRKKPENREDKDV